MTLNYENKFSRGVYKMKKVLALTVAFCLALTGVAFAASSGNIISQTEETLRRIIDETDLTVLSRVVREGHGVAIVPRMMGNETGFGMAFEREDGAWYGPTFFQLDAASAGYNVDNQVVVLFFALNDWKGVDLFAADEATIGRSKGVAAGPVFSNEHVAHAPVYSYEFSMAKGLLRGVELRDFPIRTNGRINREYWGKRFSADDALSEPAGHNISGVVNLLNKIVNFDGREPVKEEEVKKDVDLREEGRNLLRQFLEDAIKKM